MPTNVAASELNYDSYTTDQYDRDIVNSIPFHKELHEEILRRMEGLFAAAPSVRLVDLGVGTGITSKMLLDLLPNATVEAVDFSETMLEGAKSKLGEERATFRLGDYAELSFEEASYDAVVSVIGLHHQELEHRKLMFEKIITMLKPGGVFVFGDLMTYRDPHDAAYNDALHYHHLVEHAADEQALRDWAYHHKVLNQLAPVEDQEEWLRDVGFEVDRAFLRMNTGLLMCRA